MQTALRLGTSLLSCVPDCCCSMSRSAPLRSRPTGARAGILARLSLVLIAVLAVGCDAVSSGDVSRSAAKSAGGSESDTPGASANAEAEAGHRSVPGTPAAEITYADPATLPPCDWPRLFGPDANSTVTYPAALAPWPASGPPVLWRIPVGAGYSAPVVQAGRLILFHRQDDREILECRDAATGEPLWSYDWPTAFTTEVLYSIGPYSTPTVVDDRVFAIGAEAKLCCLSLASGELIWRRDLRADFQLDGINYGEQDYYGFCPSPVPADGKLIVNVGGRKSGAGIVAFDQATGETCWTATADGASYATPTCFALTAADGTSRQLAAVLTRDALVILQTGDGSVLFRQPFRTKNPDTTHATSPVVLGDVVWGDAVLGDTVFACGYGVGSLGVRVNPPPTAGTCEAAASIAWQNRRTMDSQYTNLLTLGDLVIGYPARLRGTLVAVNARTGEEAWQLRTEYARGSGVLLNGEYIVLNEEGDLLRFGNFATGVPPQLTSVISGLLPGKCFTGPVFADGRLYLRTEQEVVCLRLF